MLANKNLSCEGRFEYGSESLKEKTVVRKLTTYLVIGPVVHCWVLYRYHLTRISIRFNFDNFLAFIVGFIQLS